MTTFEKEKKNVEFWTKEAQETAMRILDKSFGPNKSEAFLNVFEEFKHLDNLIDDLKRQAELNIRRRFSK